MTIVLIEFQGQLFSVAFQLSPSLLLDHDVLGLLAKVNNKDRRQFCLKLTKINMMIGFNHLSEELESKTNQLWTNMNIDVFVLLFSNVMAADNDRNMAE